MKKRILLALGTIVLCVGAFLLVAEREVPPPQVDQKADAAPIQGFISRPTSQPERVISGGDLKLSPGDQTFAVIYDRVTGEPKYQFRADRWAPISETEFELVRPEIRIHMPGGQITHIRADEGQVELAQSGRRSVEPKRGWLRGDVRVTIDRTTRKWRAEHPDEAELEQHLDQTITIFLTDVTFDLDQARLQSNGRIRVQSVEADIDGRGLLLAWNQVDNRIDYLTIKEGKQMELRRGGRMIEFAMPGSPRESRPGSRGPRPVRSVEIARARPMQPMAVGTTAAEAASQIRAVVAQANRPAALAMTAAAAPDAARRGAASGPARDADLAALADEVVAEARGATYRGRVGEEDQTSTTTQPRGSRPKVDTYSAVFTGNVVVEQRQGLRRPGRITCEKLELIFDFGKKQKRSNLFQPRPIGDAPATPTTGKADEPIGPGSPEDTTRLILTWTGPLEMRPLVIPTDEKSGERFDAIATGRRVEVDDERGHAVCRQLVYRNENQQVWLSADDREPVVITTREREASPAEGMIERAVGALSGREVFFDRSRGVARIDGAGRMTRHPRGDAAPDEPALAGAVGDIRWTQGVEIEMRQARTVRRDPATGEKTTKVQDYISRAWFHGDVRVGRGDEEIRGTDVAATFAPPPETGSASGPLAHLDVIGNVFLRSRTDTIRGDRLEVDFDPAMPRRNVPKSAIATGNVVAQQGRRRIAADRIEVAMALLAPTDRPGAASPSNRASADRAPVAITELHAFRGVRGYDRERRFAVNADELHARIPDGRQIESAVALGRKDGSFARVKYEDYRLAGNRIEMDLRAQTADVNGPGRAYFTSDRDFGGGELRDAETVRVSWSNTMKVRGRENIAVFDGAVRARSSTHELQCRQLQVTLAESAPTRRARPATAPKLFSLASLGLPSDPLVAPRLNAALAVFHAARNSWSALMPALTPVLPPGPRGRDTLLASPDSPMVRKQPVRIAAIGKAVALRTVRHARTHRLLTRTQITADQIDVDLRRQAMNIPGRGTLLIEDYQFVAGKSRRRARAEGDRLSLLGGSEGPSQTLFLWANGMSYFVDQALVTFDRQVVMRHLSGQNVVLRDDLAAAMNVDPRALRLPAGRRAELTCDNLLAQFVRQETTLTESLDLRGGEVQQLVARGSVHLQDGSKSIMGEELTFSRETDLVTVKGATTFEARIFDQDEQSQRFNMWRGPLLVWDRSTDRIEAPQARVLSRGQ